MERCRNVGEFGQIRRGKVKEGLECNQEDYIYLKSIQSLTGRRWSCCKTGVMWWMEVVLVMIRAAQFWTKYNVYASVENTNSASLHVKEALSARKTGVYFVKKVQQRWVELCKEMRKMEKLEYKRQVLEYFTLCSLIFLSQSWLKSVFLFTQDEAVWSSGPVGDSVCR